MMSDLIDIVWCYMECYGSVMVVMKCAWAFMEKVILYEVK